MKNTVIGLALMGILVFAVKLTFAQDVQSVNGDASLTANQEDSYNSDETIAPSDEWENSETHVISDNSEANANVIKMPFIPQDNSEDPVLGMGNNDKSL